ncbi:MULTISPECIES: YcxB family protein [Chryseobacterium]|uniref:Cell division protein FtsW (Lipid II flippase) n=1 Tax=Chryseobacterium camelliae TaxID=1265445 RepID=A0ABU0TLA7_9FLAO|nr:MULTISPECIES: hypothetical protein [Chryseobacterium]MDT3409056.1 cell division protein FtsW (lipid II flippase) [Pseudacidovorax intermedius]MDQ1097085.1 cell division protein FtsW (lipid II flippase) [Chryseobacterium camelliae]MDQ1101023.1 cell division protein FtsW (lipid II flippase) [Chryseobacterium sp. SORGH_AS_1048]MDR6084465.1 cell division protein FtsW (lipid II flippase) [Chryseobacterium sp. SORGH_AS_0909]MDR6132736.1 cell division protein FtsW (lipid II flippase) [Chryseobacte
MTEEKVIVLNPERAYFEEIYFNGNQGSLFFSPTTKGKTVTTILTALILLILFLFRDEFSKEKSGILYFVSFLFLLCAVFLSVSINKVSRWKKQVNAYLDILDRCKIYEIRVNGNFFTVNIDGEKETSEWKDFTAFDIQPKYIALEGKYNYMFPVASMSKEDHQFLKKIIAENIVDK